MGGNGEVLFIPVLQAAEVAILQRQGTAEEMIKAYGMVSMAPIYRKKKSRLSERGSKIAAADSAANRKSII